MAQSPNLSAKQARFVAEYLVDGNGAAAAVRAGYGVVGAKVTACRLLTRANLQNALRARQAADATRLSLQREDVLKGLLAAVEQARTQGDPAAMIRGWSEIGKLMGYYAPETKKVDLTVAGQGEIERLSSLSDAELIKIVEGGRAA